MSEVKIQELTTADPTVKVAVFTYSGYGDPIKYLNDAVREYVGRELYNEFIDANMDNPWVRVIVKGINSMTKLDFDKTLHHL